MSFTKTKEEVVERLKRGCEHVGGEFRLDTCELPHGGSITLEGEGKISVGDTDNKLMAELFKVDDVEVLPNGNLSIASAGDRMVTQFEIEG